MKPNLEKVAAQWIARRDAGLSPAEQDELSAWLQADPRHAEAMAAVGATWTVLDRPADTGSADAVLEHLQVLERRDRRRRRRAISTGVALLVIGVVGWWQFSARNTPSIAPASVTAKLIVPRHQLLPDGTTVDLRDDAEIAVEFTPDVRRVVLRRGEAHFQVTKNLNRPFIVSANGLGVRAVGTAFSVGLGRADVEVVVNEGRVAVDQLAKVEAISVAAASDLSPSTKLVDAGSRITMPVVADAVAPAAVPATDLTERLAWRAPRLEFTGTPLGEAVTLLNEHASGGKRFVIEDASLRQLRVSGLFRADNTAAFVDLLESGFGIKAESRQGSEIVLRKAP